jgi:hypothetical protein
LVRFYNDLENEQFPQWSFVTPNLIHNGHDTDVTVSCNWTRGFVESLLANSYFNDNRIVYITWQADGLDPKARAHVAGIIVGSAVPSELIGTTDGNYYNHYSDLSTVEANWGLHHLGRWDVGANIWSFVASKTGDQDRQWNDAIAGDTFENYYWNQSYGGVFSSDNTTSHVYVAPNIELTRNGRTILPAIAELWGSSASTLTGTSTGTKKAKRDSKVNGKGKGYCIPKRKSTGLPGTATATGTATTKTGSTGTMTSSTASSTITNGLPDYYRNIIEVPDALHPPPGFAVTVGEGPPPAITTPIYIYPYEFM